MSGAPAFFVPEVSPEETEEAYRGMAALVQRTRAPLHRRVYSMTWEHNGETWKATVGETLTGEGWRAVGKGRNAERHRVQLSDAAKVLAIFEGSPGIIFHNGATRHWNQPIYTGRPLAISYFAKPEDPPSAF